MLFLISLISIISWPVFAKEISFSFDDAPRGDGAYYTGAQRAQNLVEQLKLANVPQVIFYANPGKIDSPHLLNRLKFYQASGHLIGNHTYDHISADKNSSEIFLSNILKADEHLFTEKLLTPYFRYPYLHRGKTISKIFKLHDEISNLGYQDGYVTIDTYDYYMDRVFQEALLNNKNINIENLKKFYVEILMTSINFYEQLGVKILGHSPKHVILLHENDISALCIGDLVKRLRSENWDIITPTEAYKNNDLNPLPKVLTHNQGRIAARAIELGFEGALSSGVEDESVIENLFETYKIATE